MSSKPKILMINYHYPPIISGGTQRIYNFKKYLPQYGVEAAVVTTGSYGELEDDADNHVFRFPDRGYDYTHNEKHSSIGIFLFRAYRRIQVWLGTITDGKYYWKTEVLKEIDEIIATGNYDLILASYPSAANLEIGEYVYKKHKIPLIVDYRDAILFEPFKSRWGSFFLAKKRLASLERRMAKIASLHLTVNKEMNDYYQRTYPKVKSVIISNGFDDEEIISAEPLHLPQGFNIIYTGGIAKSRMVYDFETITKTLGIIFNSNPEINYTFIGDYEDRERIFFSRFNNVHVLPKVERGVILATQKIADAFLLISGPSGGTSGKLYEYLFAKKPIINIGSKVGIASIIDGEHFGRTFDVNETDEMVNFIGNIKDGKLILEFPYLEQYTRRYQSSFLANEIKNLLCIDDSQK